MREQRFRVQKQSTGREEKFYLYTGSVPHADFPKEQSMRIPRVIEPSGQVEKTFVENLTSPALWNSIFEISLDTLGMMLENHEPGGPGQAGRQIAKNMRETHQAMIVSPRDNQAFTAQKDIPLNTQHYSLSSGFNGDVVMQNLVLGKGSPVAHVWIVSTEPPGNVNENQHIDARAAAVFFSKNAADNFLKNIRVFCGLESGREHMFNMSALQLSTNDNKDDFAANIFMLNRVITNLQLQANTPLKFAPANNRIKNIHALTQQILSLLPVEIIQMEEEKTSAEAEKLQVSHPDSYYKPQHKFEVTMSSQSVDEVNALVKELTHELKNYLIFYSSNNRSRDPNQDSILDNLTILSNLSEIQKAKVADALQNSPDRRLTAEEKTNDIQENEDKLSFHDEESDLQVSPPSSPLLGKLTDEIRVSSSGFFTPPPSRRVSQSNDTPDERIARNDHQADEKKEYTTPRKGSST